MEEAMSLSKFGEKMLAGLTPKATAKGGCPPDPYTQYWCDTNHDRYRRTCSTNGACVTFCSPWVYVSTC
jgi:hypothetical protein